MNEKKMKISKTGKIIIFVLLIVIIGLIFGIFFISNQSKKESHYVSLDDGDSTNHVVDDDGTVSHIKSDSVKTEWAAYAKVQVLNMDGGDVNLSVNNNVFGTIPVSEDEDNTLFRYYLINSDDDIDVYKDVVTLTIDDFSSYDDLASMVMVYQPESEHSDEEINESGAISNPVLTYGVYSNDFSSIDYKYDSYFTVNDVFGTFNLAYDTSLDDMNDKYQCNNLVAIGTTQEKSNVSMSFEDNKIIISSTSDITDLSINWTYDGSYTDESDSDNSFKFGDSYYAELSNCQMTYNKSTKLYEYIWSSDVACDKQYFN